jgi:hypothetical protein
MRVIKSLLLGAAAGLAATAGVQAADMPVKAKAVEYVKICSAYGAGFYYIPGTDICLRLGGRVRADYYHNGTGASPDISSGNSRSENTHAFRSRGMVTMDARNETAYGTLRAFFNSYWNFTTGSSSTSPSASRGFIQFAGFTFGRATSFYDFFDSGAYANMDSYNIQTTDASGWNVLAYTAQLGNGMSASISLEDMRRGGVIAGAPVFGAASVRAGLNVPAVVVNLRTDQKWGSAQIMSGVQELRTTEASVPSNIDTYGYAVGAGFTLNNPSAPGSQFGIQTSWARGATGFISTLYAGHNILDGAPAGGVAATGLLADGVVTGGALYKTDAWAVNLGYQHRFTPQWAWSIVGGYTSVDYAPVVDALCGISCDFDFWSAGSRLLWTPVSGLNFGLDLMYHDFGTQTGATALAAAGVGALRRNEVWSSMLRVQRDF